MKSSSMMEFEGLPRLASGNAPDLVGKGLSEPELAIRTKCDANWLTVGGGDAKRGDHIVV
jgi:hypothetical protein